MLERPQSDVRLSVEAIDGAWKVRQFRKKEDYGVMKMITLKLKIKDIEVELTHVEALKLYNELSLFFNWQPTSISPQYPIVNYRGMSNPEIPTNDWEHPITARKWNRDTEWQT